MTNQRFACVLFLFVLCCVLANSETATLEEIVASSEAGRVAFRNIVITPAK